MNTTEKPIVLFDGVCNFCDSSVQFILRHDKREVFMFAALQSEAGDRLLKKFGLATDDYDTFVLVEGERFTTKSTAALRLMKHLGGWWKLFYAFIIVPRPIRDFCYTLFARYRYRLFGKKDSCMMPTPEVRRRFL